MKDWTKMSATDWYTDGVQTDLLAGVVIKGDGCGTIPMELVPDQADTVAEVERMDGTLFGLALSEAPATDGGLFTVVAA